MNSDRDRVRASDEPLMKPFSFHNSLFSFSFSLAVGSSQLARGSEPQLATWPCEAPHVGVTHVSSLCEVMSQ